MRTLLLAVFTLLTVLGHSSCFGAENAETPEDPLASFRFLDGQDHRLSDWPGQPVLVMYFCGFCPTARAWMADQGVAVGKQIETDHLAAQLVCVTPELSGEALKNYEETVCKAIKGTALFANDPVNRRKISLKNISQAELWIDGAARGVDRSNLVESVKDPFHASTAFLFPISCELTPAGKTAWWAVERGRPGAFAACVTSAKKSPEAKSIVEAVSKALVARQGPLVAAPASMATYEALEALCADGAGLPELKPSAERLRALAKDKSLTSELKARDIFRTATKQAASVKPNDRETGKTTLVQLALKMPDTVYGKKAAETK